MYWKVSKVDMAVALYCDERRVVCVVHTLGLPLGLEAEPC